MSMHPAHGGLPWSVGQGWAFVCFPLHWPFYHRGKRFRLCLLLLPCTQISVNPRLLLLVGVVRTCIVYVPNAARSGEDHHMIHKCLAFFLPTFWCLWHFWRHKNSTWGKMSVSHNHIKHMNHAFQLALLQTDGRKLPITLLRCDTFHSMPGLKVGKVGGGVYT